MRMDAEFYFLPIPHDQILPGHRNQSLKKHKILSYFSIIYGPYSALQSEKLEMAYSEFAVQVVGSVHPDAEVCTYPVLSVIPAELVRTIFLSPESS